jgi:hypothetical protein
MRDHPARIRNLPDTPPVDVFVARQVSWLAGHDIRPAFPVLCGTSGLIDRMLAAYSCGGSFGIVWPVMGITHRIPVLASDANRKNLEH